LFENLPVLFAGYRGDIRRGERNGFLEGGGNEMPIIFTSELARIIKH